VPVAVAGAVASLSRRRGAIRLETPALEVDGVKSTFTHRGRRSYSLDDCIDQPPPSSR
jgi:hypothetical protein